VVGGKKEEEEEEKDSAVKNEIWSRGNIIK
jgi:hypothetical protein